jgi:hypothetical protein
MLTVFVLVALGCSFGSKVTTKSSQELPRYQVQTIAFVPLSTIATPQVTDPAGQVFQAPEGARRSDIAVAIPSDVEPPKRPTAVVPASAAERITQLLWNRLRAREGIRVYSPSDTARAIAASLTGKTQPHPHAVAAQAASSLKADAALIGQVLVYQERVGSRLGANPPASVGFEVKVVAADGQVLWEGNYYEKQRPLTEDARGFFERHGAFVTADELAQYGVDEMLKEFPFGQAAK